MKLKHEVIRTRFPRIRVLKDRAKKYQVDARPLAPRKSFATKGEATTYADSIAISKTNQGTESLTALSAEQRVAAVRAFKVLHEHGRTLTDAVDFLVAHIDREKKRHASLSVEACLDEYLAQLKGEVDRKTFALTSYRMARMYVNLFKAAFAGLHLTDLTECRVRAYLDSLAVGPRSRFNYRRSLNKFLNWCVSAEHLEKNPCARIKLRVPSHDVVVLSVEDAKRLLRAAMDAPLRAYFSIACLAGMRPSEIQRLDWSDVRLDTRTITVWKHKTKVKETRYVPINDALAAWLEPIAKKSGNVTPRNWRFQFRGILKAAGYSSERRYVPDSMRHSFGSSWLALHKNRAELAEVMGNSVRVIRSSYRAPVMESDARAYFALTPDALRKAHS
jgi:integrase